MHRGEHPCQSVQRISTNLTVLVENKDWCKMGGPTAPSADIVKTPADAVDTKVHTMTPSVAPIGLVASSATGEVLSTQPNDIVVRFHTSRTEPDIDGMFLASRESSTLGPAAARWKTDFHCTGNAKTTSPLITEKGAEVDVVLDKSQYTLSDTGLTINIKDRTRLNITTSRKAVAIDGTWGTTMSGQASVGLDECFEHSESGVSALVQVSYANWADMSSVLQVSDPKIIDAKTGTEITNVVFSVDDETDTTCKEAEDVLESVYNAGMQTRSVVVFEPAPPLSKTVMRVPFGVNGSTYDFACNVVDRPPSLSRKAFESLARAALLKEMDMDTEAVDAVLEQCKLPGIAATRWASKVANSMSTIVNLCCPYRIDGVSTILPDGISLVAAESWKAEAARDPCVMDDCDGSAAFSTSQLCDACVVARSEELSQTYPVTAAFANAMAHHSVGLCILSANAGNAEAAGGAGAAAVAGHAIALAIPKPMILRALVTGLAATLQEKPREVADAARNDLAPLWARGLYAQEDVARMPVEERAVVTESYDRLMNLPTRLPDNAGFVPFSMEGTSPVSPSTLYPTDDLDTIRRRKLGKLDKEVEKLIGPGVTRTVVQLDVADEGDDHVFYKDFVEFLMPMRGNPMFTDPKLRERGFATSQFVFTQATDPRRAGATPKQTAEGSFGLLPLWKLNTEKANVVDVAIQEVKRNTLPFRDTPKGHVLSKRESSIFNSNLHKLRSITRSASVTPADKKHDVQHLISFAALASNEYAVDAFAKRISEINALDVFVDVVDVPSLIVSDSGEDIGKMVVINLRADV